MASAHIAGTFTTTSAPVSLGQISDVCVVPRGGALTVTVSGLDAQNQVRLERRTSPGGSWSTAATYSSNQTSTSVASAANDEFRLVQVTQQPVRDVRYVLNAL